jgi:TRAP-type C4-dicarboxylate transport system permease small subunit
MTPFFRFLDAAIQWLGNASLAFAAVFIALLAVIGTADSIGTQIFNAPVPSALEISQAGLVVVVFMGLAYAQRRRAHVAVDIFTGRFEGKMKMAFTGLALIAAITFFSFVAWRSGISALASIAVDERSWGLTRFPIWPSKIALFIGCIIAGLESIRQFVHLCLGNPDAFEAHSPDEEVP